MKWLFYICKLFVVSRRDEVIFKNKIVENVRNVENSSCFLINDINN